MDKMFKKLCTPAQIYFGIAVIASIVALFRGVTFGRVFMNLIFAFIWTYILGWLCKKGFSAISWFLVLLPYIVIALAMLRIARIDQHKAIFRSVGLQGAYGQEAYTSLSGAREQQKDTDEEKNDIKNKREGLRVRKRM
jgi:hypothetical protein